jgi:transposase
LPPRSTLYDYFDLLSWDGTLDRIHHALCVECRERAERWVVERTFAGLDRCRRLAKDWECLNRLNPSYAPKAMQSKIMFPDRL